MHTSVAQNGSPLDNLCYNERAERELPGVPTGGVVNQTLLVSDPKWFGIQEINPYESAAIQPDRDALMHEHQTVVEAFRASDFIVEQVASPKHCLDGVYTANWAVVHGDTAVLADLPRQRSAELIRAEQELRRRFRVLRPPARFSGQGDCLRLRDELYIMGYGYRTSPVMTDYIAGTFGVDVIALKAKPKRDRLGRPAINRLTGWPESYYYDIDLAVGIIDESTIVSCLKALEPTSREHLVRSSKLYGFEIIEVTVREAREAYACNLVSNGHTVIMAAGAPRVAAELRHRGKDVLELPNSELRKGGGGFRCISLTLAH